MVAYKTAVSTFKIVKSNKPSYIATKLGGRQVNTETWQEAGAVIPPKCKLNIKR